MIGFAIGFAAGFLVRQFWPKIVGLFWKEEAAAVRKLGAKIDGSAVARPPAKPPASSSSSSASK